MPHERLIPDIHLNSREGTLTAPRAPMYPPSGTRAFLRSASPITRPKIGLAARRRRAPALGK